MIKECGSQGVEKDEMQAFIGLRLGTATKQRLQQKAQRCGISLSELVRNLLCDYIDSEKQS